MSRCLKWVGLGVAVVVITFAVFINAARILMPLLNSQRDYFQHWASQILHEPVHIGKITAGWNGFDPALNFQQVAITDAEEKQTLLHISRLSISIDFFHSLLHWQLLPGHLLISGAKLAVYQQADGHFQLQGLNEIATQSVEKNKVDHLKNVLLWLLTQSDVGLNQIDVDYHTANGELIPIENLRLQVRNIPALHQIIGAAAIAQTPTQFRFVLNMREIDADHVPGKADLYVQANQVILPQLFNDQWARKYLQRWQVVSGQANMQGWLKWRKGQLKSAQTVIDSVNIDMKAAQPTQSVIMSRFQANLYWHPDAAGVDHLTAVIDMSPATVDLPAWFFKPLAINQLHLLADWRRDNQGWQLVMPVLQVADNEMNWRGHLTLTQPLNGALALDTALQFDIKNLTAIPNYLPRVGLKPGLIAWFREAFLHGSMTDGKLIFQGPLNQFPFDQNQGKFDVSAHLNHLKLRYSPEWPLLENIQGTFTVHDSQLHVFAETGTTLGSAIEQVHADFADLRNPILMIEGRAVTDLTKGIQFLHHAPLTAAKEMAGMVATGPMVLNLKLMIPLDDKNAAVSDGQIIVHQGQLNLPNWGFGLSHINGQFNFHNHDLSATKVAATLMDMPLTADLATVHPTPNQSMLQLNFNGQLNMALLRRQDHLPLLKYFEGSTPYHAVLQMHDEDTGIPNQLQITSDLQGLQSTLPAPYDKTAVSAQALHLQMNFAARQPLHLTVQYGDLFSAAIRAIKKNVAAPWQVQSGEIHLGAGVAHDQSQSGLLITAKLNQLDAAAWQTFWSQQPASANAGAWRELPIRAVELAVDHLDWDPYHLTDAFVSITPMNQGWMVMMQNQMVAGRLFIPKNKLLAWRGHFDHLYLLKGKNTTTPIDPRHLPPLHLSINDFRYDQKEVGKVALKTVAVPAGLQLTGLKVISPLNQIKAVGTWQIVNGKTQTTLYGNLESSDLGTVLKNWQITQVLEGSKGNANFSLSWPGAPQQFTTAHLNGDVKFDFREGRVTHLSQSAESELGFGRLLNLFSLQSIPLLPLHLVNLGKKGFYFKLFTGDFQLVDGNADTENTSLVGPVAWVQVNGRIGFAAKNYHLALEVIPNVTSSLPLIVGLAGGPLAGAITWVADKILAHQVGKAAQVNYQITGSWDNPTIVKIQKPTETK